MQDQSPEPTPTFRDIVAAWLLCALIALLALGLSSERHGTPISTNDMHSAGDLRHGDARRS
jgi:hypothetical protein